MNKWKVFKNLYEILISISVIITTKPNFATLCIFYCFGFGKYKGALLLWPLSLKIKLKVDIVDFCQILRTLFWNSPNRGLWIIKKSRYKKTSTFIVYWDVPMSFKFYIIKINNNNKRSKITDTGPLKYPSP